MAIFGHGVTVTEPIGLPDQLGALGPFNVYLNGVLVPPANYTVAGTATVILSCLRPHLVPMS